MRYEVSISPKTKAWTIFEDRRKQMLSAFNDLTDLGFPYELLKQEMEATQSAMDQIMVLRGKRG